MSYPLEVRRHILSVREKEGLTYKQTAQRFGVGTASLARWSKRLERKTPEGRPRKIDLEHLHAHVRSHAAATLDERTAHFGVTRNAVFEALRKIGVTYKKSPASSEGGWRKTAHVLRRDQGARD